MWVTAKEIKNKLNICSQTLYNWRIQGKIQYKIINQRLFLYNIESIEGFKPEQKRKNVIYSRVSNTKQHEDLKRQTKLLQEYMVTKGIIPEIIFEDIASGMNENRDNFNKLLLLVFKNEVDTVFITYSDRLIRFGFNLLKSIFLNFGTRIEIINATKEEDFQQELTNDLVSIIHHFSMKMYSNRRKVLKNIKKELLQNNENN